MPKAIYVNLPVTDLDRAKRFLSALGFTINEQFSNDQAAGLAVSETIYVMLHTPESIRRFTAKEIADAHKTTEVLLALQVESKAEVDAFLQKALAAGATEPREPEDHGFMYGRAFEDPDGHIWEAFFLDVDQMPR